jgi:hypothetical protein
MLKNEPESEKPYVHSVVPQAPRNQSKVLSDYIIADLRINCTSCRLVTGKSILYAFKMKRENKL